MGAGVGISHLACKVMTASGNPDETAPRADSPHLASDDREATLALLVREIAAAWESFERPRPSEPPLTPELEARLREPLPERHSHPDEVLADAARVLDASISPTRPLYLGYIGSTGLDVGVLANSLAATYDVNLAATARAADLVERQALEWLAEFVGYPLAEGAFTSGGMISNLSAMLVAREQALPGSRRTGVGGARHAVYCSQEAHHSVIRAVEASGLGSDCVRVLVIDAQRRLRPTELAAAIAADREAGVTPVAIVANGGTTLTGAVDPLADIADIAQDEGVWLHVDGAYGLPAAASASHGHLFAGVERADSVTVDLHKWLGVQKSCSAVLVRHRGTLETSFGHQETYLSRDEDEVANAVERTLEYSRPFRSLAPWVAFRVHGASSFRVWIEHTLTLAERFAAMIRAAPRLELVVEPTLSTVCFRHLAPGLDGTGLDAHNARTAAAIQRDGRVFLAPAEVDGRTCLRVCFVNFRTRLRDLELIVETVDAIAASLADGAA
jgi:aromatic-L-amino-acid/L-tryptophan decarboxylase